MTTIVVVGDTHVRTWDEVDERLRRLVERADIAIHCGDWVHLDVVEGFQRAARRSVVVHGNSDPPELRRALPYREVIEVDGVRIGVTHPAWGGPEFPAKELLPDFPADLFGRVDIICYGHIHVASLEEVDGVRFVNPGQGYASFMVPGTYATIEVERGRARPELCEFAPAL